MSYNFQLHNDDEFQPQDEALTHENAAADSHTADHARLRMVDHLLSTAPMLAPRFDFAERVMKAIRQHQAQMNRSASLGLALGLSFSVLLLLGLAAAGILSLVNVALHWSRFYQQMVVTGGEIGTAVTGWIEEARAGVTDSPVLMVLALLSIPMFFIWLWVMRQLIPNEESH